MKEGLRILGRLLRSEERGQAMVEFAVVFPLQLLITLLVIQISLIMVGKQVVNYAAFCAARAELVGESPEDAAVTVCTPISGTVADDETGEPITLPGWREETKPDFEALSRRSRDKVRVTIEESPADGADRVVARVNFDFEMSLPFVGWVIYYTLDALSPGLVHVKGLEETSGPPPDKELATVIQGVPHIILKEQAVVASPWPEEASLAPHEFIEEFEEEEP
jgi:hypothetical protein